MNRLGYRCQTKSAYNTTPVFYKAHIELIVKTQAHLPLEICSSFFKQYIFNFRQKRNKSKVLRTVAFIRQLTTAARV